jgi:rhodanese-related sulfurtransferase
MENFFLLFGSLIFGFGLYLKNEKTKNHSQKITSKVAKQLINCGAIVLDVRTINELKIGYYGNSIHIPLNQITKETLLSIKKTDIIIIYCNSGTRARKAGLLLIKYGYKNVYYITESYLSLK